MNKKPDTSFAFAAKSGLMQVPMYPLHLAKVLMQIGYEPLPPVSAKSLFGKDVLYLPNVFKYLRYIYTVEGPSGLFRGVGMRIMSQLIGTIGYNNALLMIEESNPNMKAEIDLLTKEGRLFTVAVRLTQKDVLARCWAVIISHPIHVMGLRCMVQFIGGESKYSSWNIFQNCQEIYNGEGVGGFFKGLVPRLLFEASTIVITNLVAYLIKTYVINDTEMEPITDLTSTILAGSVTYPLSVVSTVSAISGADLVAARPPRMLMYGGWVDVAKDLYYKNHLKRGASSIYRTYIPAIGAGLVNTDALMSGYKLA